MLILGKNTPTRAWYPATPNRCLRRCPWRDYALSRLGEDANETSDVRVRSLLRGLVANSFFSLAAGVDDRAFNYNRLAEKVWQRYMKKVAGSEKRVGLPPLKSVRLEVLDQLLGPNSDFPDDLKARPADRVTTWHQRHRLVLDQRSCHHRRHQCASQVRRTGSEKGGLILGPRTFPLAEGSRPPASSRVYADSI